jgi:phosphatidylserine/phosphatidylglycerophosphate/cardiolipin synthase-like enzyme
VLTRKSDSNGSIPIIDAWVDRNGNNVAERYMHEKGITVNGVWAGRPDVKVVYSGSQNFAPASTTDNNELIMRHFSDSTYDAYAENFRFIRKKVTRRLW